MKIPWQFRTGKKLMENSWIFLLRIPWDISVRALHRRVLVNGFGKARSEARRAKVGGPRDRERGEVLWAYKG